MVGLMAHNTIQTHLSWFMYQHSNVFNHYHVGLKKTLTRTQLSGRTKLWAQCSKLAVRNVKPLMLGNELSLKARFGEHRRPSFTVSEVSKHIHTDSPNHIITLENTKILPVEHKWFKRGVKEAIHIQTLKRSLNRGGG